MRKICFITGSRAEYGLLRPIMQLVKESADCELQIIATNMHLLPEYGETYREIEEDGFLINEKVVMSKPSDDSQGIVSSMAQEMIGLNNALSRLKPDLVVILGDRYEMMVSATVCMIHQIPIAHIHGGEVTEGAFDDSIRHCITKMSSLHFAATDSYRRRIIQLGEDPKRVWNVGSIGVENVFNIKHLSKEELTALLGISLDRPFLLVTYHPETRGTTDIDALLAALDSFIDYDIVFTMPNSDNGSNAISSAIIKYCNDHHERAHCFTSLGVEKYISLVRLAEAVVGNSSSAIIEVPSAGVPSLNIGDRQRGRISASSVINCSTDKVSIIAGLNTVLNKQFKELAKSVENPYHRPGTIKVIYDIISTYPLDELKTKKFHDINQ